MDGAIFYASKNGSTARYADRIGAATGLPVFDIGNAPPPESLDFIVVGSPVIYYGLLIEKWVSEHLDTLTERPVVFFSVSDAGEGAQLDGWIAESLPQCFVEHATHVALPGALPGLRDPAAKDWQDGATPGLEADREERVAGEMGRDSIEPVVAAVRSLRARAAV